jgi:hypothetical protein
MTTGSNPERNYKGYIQTKAVACETLTLQLFPLTFNSEFGTVFLNMETIQFRANICIT